LASSDSKPMIPNWIAKAVLVVSAVLFLLATFAEGISWETMIIHFSGFQNPLGAFYLLALLVSVGVMLFGVTLSFVNFRVSAANKQNFLWVPLLSAGVLAIPLFFVDLIHTVIAFSGLLFPVCILLISVVLTFGSLGGKTAERRHFLGSEVLAGGVLAMFFAIYSYLFYMEDEGPPCLGGCAPSLLLYYQEVYVGMAILAILGLVVAGFGIRLLIRKENPIERGTLSMLDNRKNDTVAI